MPDLDFLRARALSWSGRPLARMAHRGRVWSAPALPEGGEVAVATIDGVTYRVHTFAAAGEFVCPAPLAVQYFLVGGGGTGVAAKSDSPRGGGAGGRVIHNLGGQPLALAAGRYPVAVGAGGTGSGQPGLASSFSGIVAAGGRGGSGGAGGNQGGTGGFFGGLSGVTGQPGGGGAGAGGNGQNGADGGLGGPGSFHNPDGNPRWFASGGRGNYGGAGRDDADTNTDGLGGGSAGRRVSGSATSAPGGSGIVILRYPLSSV